MPGFNAATVVEPLDWTFEPDVPGARGTIREPRDAQIGDYLSAVKKMSAELKGRIPEGVDPDDPQELLAAIDSLDTDIVVQVHAKMARVYADLCSGSPTTEQILALPLRKRVMFYAWLQEQVMAPEAVPGGGSTPGQTRTLSAAGSSSTR